MQTLAQSAKRHISAAILVLFVAALALPSILAGYASAAQITTRSVTLSTSAASASSVIYLITFNIETPGTLRSVVVDFDGASPIIGDSLTTVTGLTVGQTSPTASPATGNDVAGTWTADLVNTDALTLTASADQTVSQGDTFSYSVAGFVNPSATGTFYARVLTYSTTGGASGYTATNPGSFTDAGGVAMSINDTIGVTATVKETLTFCVSGPTGDDFDEPPTNNCADTEAPAVVLGHGSPIALDGSQVDEDDVYFQLSTNASGDTVIRLKGADIDLASGSNTIVGVNHVSAPQPLVSGANGNFGFRVVGGGGVTPASRYNSGTPGTGNIHSSVEGTYGDIIAQTTGPIANANSQIIFGAIAGSLTPAGVYTGNYSVIATPSY